MIDKTIGVANRLIEFCLLLVVAFSPWLFGSVHPPFELWVTAGVALCLAILGLRVLVEGHITWPETMASQAFVFGLYLLFLVATIQALPLPRTLIDIVSPNTTHYVQSLIPSQREVVTVGKASEGDALEEDATIDSVALASHNRYSVGNKISLNPGGSYGSSVRFITLAALFMVVCSLPGSTLVLHRFSWAVTIVGTAFALFGIVQMLSASKNQLYWYFETNGNGFAGFRNRNHYPFFANMALGLSIGLLLERGRRFGRGSWAAISRDVVSLWLGACIIFMMVSNILCASRGGFVAMLVAFAVALLPRLQSIDRSKAMIAAGGIVLVGMLLLAFLGVDLAQSRLTTLVDSKEMREESRWHLWTAALQAIPQFPIFGAGGETFRYWETMLHQNETWNSAIHEGTRADNEFLDVFVEFGVLGFLGLLAMTGALLWHGFKVASQNELAHGVWIAMVAVIVHSCFDFGLRVPACAIVATICAALLTNIPYSDSLNIKSNASTTTSQPDVRLPNWSARFGAVGFSVVCLLLAVFLVKERVRHAAAFNLYYQAMRALQHGEADKCMNLLKESTRSAPEDVSNQLEVTRVALRCVATAQNEAEQARYSAVALNMALDARDLCPIAFEPHFWLAQGYDQIESTQSKADYLARAHFLHPSGSVIAYQYGEQLYAAGRYDEAWPVWRDSIRFNGYKMGKILVSAREILTPQEVAARLLPEDPMRLYEAANMAENSGDREAAAVYLSKVLKLIPSTSSQSSSRSEETAALAALVAKTNLRLNNTSAAIDAFERALTYQPANNEWRLSLSQLLIQEKRYEEASRQLRTALLYEPENVTLKTLRQRAIQLQKESKR